jgi:hypothetical protein
MGDDPQKMLDQLVVRGAVEAIVNLIVRHRRLRPWANQCPRLKTPSASRRSVDDPYAMMTLQQHLDEHLPHQRRPNYEWVASIARKCGVSPAAVSAAVRAWKKPETPASAAPVDPITAAPSAFVDPMPTPPARVASMRSSTPSAATAMN